MRLIIIILLLTSLYSEGQIINASPAYRPVAASCSYLLDQYSGAAAAYSLRKLDCDYTGYAIRVRRASDNSEQDIGFTSSGDLDTAALKTFVSTNSGYVVTWYDQSGNSRNAEQSTSAAQPQIMDNGVILRKNGYVGMFSDGSNDQLNINMNITSNLAYFFANVSRETGGISERYLGFSINSITYDWANTNGIAAISLSTTNLYQYRNSAFGGQKSISAGIRYIVYSFINGTEMGISYNNSSINMAITYSTPLNSTIGSIFSAPGSISNAWGKFYSNELIIYLADKSSDKNSIISNINNYWGVY